MGPVARGGGIRELCVVSENGRSASVLSEKHDSGAFGVRLWTRLPRNEVVAEVALILSRRLLGFRWDIARRLVPRGFPVAGSSRARIRPEGKHVIEHKRAFLNLELNFEALPHVEQNVSSFRHNLAQLDWLNLPNRTRTRNIANLNTVKSNQI